MKRFTRSMLVSSFAIGSTFLATGAHAGSATSNMTVSASVTASCTISAGALSFGAYDPVSANAAADLAGSATLAVACTSGGSATIALGDGLHPAGGSSATVPLRRLNDGGANNLAYFLYTDALKTTVWGAAAAARSYTGTGASENITVYGKVTAGQNVPAGSFADTVVATINF